MKFNAHLSALMLVYSLLGCVNTPVKDDAKNEKSPSPPGVTIEIADPWSITHTITTDGRSILATNSHSKDYLELFEVGRDRSVRSIVKDDRVGFHPDGMRWYGNRDLFVCAEGSSAVEHWTFENGQFEKRQRIQIKHPPISLQPADLDQDGRVDLVVSPYSNATMTLLWNEGNGAYTEKYLAADRTPHYARVVDWDKDGKLDILWTDYYRGSIRLAHNEGKRNFKIKLLQEQGPGTPRQLELGDLDGDGYPDIIVAMETGKVARILFNDGKGGVAADKVEIPAPIYGYSGVGYVLIDGKPMLALSENGQIILTRPKLAGNPRGEWELRGLEAGAIPQDLQFADLDQDGITDFYFTNMGDKKIQMYFGPLWEKAGAPK